MLIHATSRWPAVINVYLWPYALRYAAEIHNNTILLQNKLGNTPSEIFSGAQVQEASETQKENLPNKEIQMRQNVIPVLKLKIQSLTSKIQCDALEIKQLGQEKAQLIRDLNNMD